MREMASKQLQVGKQADKEFLYSSRQLPEVFKLPLIIAFSCKVHFLCGGRREQSFCECVCVRNLEYLSHHYYYYGKAARVKSYYSTKFYFYQ